MRNKIIISSRSRRNSFRRWIYRHFTNTRHPSRQVMMIMGAQRSGTTLLSRIFDDLYFANVYGEFSPLSTEDPAGLRLDEKVRVLRILDKSRANLIVMKPLVESQKALEWLQCIPRSKVVWLYRDYLDVSASNVAKFGDKKRGGVNHIKAFVDPEFAERTHQTWKAENASELTLNVLKSLYQEDMNLHDAAGLFWYARNVLFFEQKLDRRSDVVLIKYEDLVRHPFIVIAYILNKFAIYELKSDALSSASNISIGKGGALSLSTSVDSHCKSLQNRLDEQYLLTPLGRMLNTELG